MPSNFTPEQQRLEELAERCLAEAETAMETNEGFLFAAITGAKDWEDAQIRLLECWPKLSSDALADILHRGLVAAECWGRLTVENEAEEEARRGASRSAKTADFAAGDPTDIRLEPLVMKEALEFWKTKMLLGEADFKRLDDRAKTRAFAVAGLAKGRELEQVYQALTRAIAKGTTLADFQSECADIFERRGWVDNIFRTNIQTAYNVGRYKQQKEQAKFFPYLRYSAVNDSRTRPTHRAMDGLIYPIDHEFWDHWYPPNGFRCRCGTRSLTKGQVERGGLKVETEDPTGSLIEPAAVNGGKLPPVRLLPDKGFDYHPGKVAWGGILKEGEKPGKWQDMILPEQPKDGPKPLQKLSARNLDLPDFPVDKMLPGGLTDAQCKEAFNNLYLDKKTGEYLQVTDKLGEMVLLSPRIFQTDKGRKEEDLKGYKPGHSEIIPLLAEMIEEPFEIWLTPQEDDTGRVRLLKRYIGLWQDEEGEKVAGLAMFEVVDGILQGVTAYLPQYTTDDDDPGAFRPNVAYVNKVRNGYRLYRRGRENRK